MPLSDRPYYREHFRRKEETPRELTEERWRKRRRPAPRGGASWIGVAVIGVTLVAAVLLVLTQ